MTRLRPVRNSAILGAIAGIPAAVAWAFSPMTTFVPNAPHYVTASLIVAAIGLPFGASVPGQAIVVAGTALASASAGSAVIVALARGDVPSIAASACEWAALSTVWRC